MSNAGCRSLQVRLAGLHLRRAGRTILRNINWTIRPAEHWVLVGANGVGKTQLLKVIAGIVWPVPGTHAVRQYRIGTERATEPFGFKEKVAYVGAERQDKYQRYGWNMRAERIAATGLYHTDILLDRTAAADAQRIRRALRSLGVAHLARRPFLKLSYGERRVILLARALLSRPRLLLLDEVLNGLDPLNRKRILGWLARRGRRLPWVLTTHRIADVPPGATHALVLAHGRIAYRGRLRGARLSRWLEAPSRAAALAGRGVRRGRLLLQLRDACVHLHGRRVLSAISFTIHTGEWWGVHGPNGSGKTTLLRTLYGDHGVAVGGTIVRAGIVSGVPLEEFRKRVGLVAPHLQADYPRELPVEEVVQSGRHASIGLNEAPSRADRVAARRALALFGLGALASRPLGELSYGQARRVLFARAWARKPGLLLLDEPFAGIDTRTRRLLRARVMALARAGAAVISTSHHGRDVDSNATHELELVAGRMRYCGPLRAVREDKRRAARVVR